MVESASLKVLGRRLRLGMVGGGAQSLIGETHRIASRLDGLFDLVAGCFSADPDRSRAMGRRLMLPEERCYPSYGAMAATEAGRSNGIDAVTICTPPESHADIARAFLDQGIHVICDKPLTDRLETGRDLATAARKSGLVFALTYNYAAYPLIREARHLVSRARVGTPRVVCTEFAVGTAGMIDDDPDVSARHWRFDPDRVGRAGIFLEIGTHAFHLTEFVAGRRVEAVSAQLSTQSPGRQVYDNAFVMLRFEGGGVGHVWLSYTATGSEHGLGLRLHASKSGLTWHQESPNSLRLSPPDGPATILTRGMTDLSPAAQRMTRVRPGHPEGFHDAFANVYLDAAERIAAYKTGRTPDSLTDDMPTADDGLRGLAFMEAALSSHDRDGAWAPVV